jgi:hypothetical protein
MEGEGKLKAPRRAHYEVLARAGDREAKDLLQRAGSLRKDAAYLWNWWLEISAGYRQAGGMGIAPITGHDVHRWAEDNYQDLEPWERKAILKIDALWRASALPDPKED